MNNNNKNLSVIILAAGRGTRMKSCFSKLMHKIGNLELANHTINTARKLNTQEIVAVVSEDNINELQSNLANDIKFIVQHDRNGTGGATKIGLQKIAYKNNDILVMLGDVALVKPETYQKMIDTLHNTNSVMCVLGCYISDLNKRYGRLMIKPNNELDKITEWKDLREEDRTINICNAGSVVVNGAYLEEFLSKLNNNNAGGEFYLTDIIEIARKQNLKCSYIVADEDETIGVNSREELAKAETIFQNYKRKEFMEKGVSLIDPKTVYFSSDTEIENDVIIEPNVVFLRGVKIESNVRINAFSYLEKCYLKSGVSIGPFARIRPDTTLEENVHIGNFVEVKKSHIHKDVKIGHLTYIGDTEIGENTNVGAGTITCNYNGFTKAKTKIGKDCFVGSNTIFVAPVEIEDNVLTGAGSIITKKVEANSIAVSRAEQRIIENGKIKYDKKYGN